MPAEKIIAAAKKAAIVVIFHPMAKLLYQIINHPQKYAFVAYGVFLTVSNIRFDVTVDNRHGNEILSVYIYLNHPAGQTLSLKKSVFRHMRDIFVFWGGRAFNSQAIHSPLATGVRQA